MISNEQLRASFVTPAMAYYFERKLAPLPKAEVDARVDELLKYLNLAAHSHGGIPFSDEIDDVWHLWIMQTRQYMQLCMKLQGGKLIHHSSNDYEEFTDKELRTRPIDLERAVGLLRAYVVNYGPFEADRVRYWTVADRLIKNLGWTIDRLNAWLGAAPVETAVQQELALETAQ